MPNIITPGDVRSDDAAKKFGRRPSGVYIAIDDDLFCFKPDELDDCADVASSEIISSEVELRRLRRLPALCGPLPDRWDIIHGDVSVELDRYFEQPSPLLALRPVRCSTMSPSSYLAASRAAALLDMDALGLLDLLKHLHRIVGFHTNHVGLSGQFRRVQVHISTSDRRSASFIPPSCDVMYTCLEDLERFYVKRINTGSARLVDIIRLGYQFLAIHPFRDANARVAHLLFEIVLRRNDFIGPGPLFLRHIMWHYHFPHAILFKRVVRDSEWAAYIGFVAALLSKAASSTANWYQSLQ